MVKNKFITGRTLLFISTFFILNSIFFLAHATIRYVSTTGSSTPPYTSWETAADSIQKCINFSMDGDTIIVANGVYKERLIITKILSLLGLSMDSTVIDSRGIVGTGDDSLSTIVVHGHFVMKNFFIIGFGNVGFGAVIIWGRGDASGITIEECRIENGQTAIAFKNNDNRAESNIIKNVKNGISTGDLNNTASYFTKNNLILLSVKDAYGIFHSGGGLHEITNNIILFTNPSLLSEAGIFMHYGGKTLIKNNIIAGFNWNHFYQDPQQLDSAYIINNLFGYSGYNNPLGAILNISDGSRKVVKNNLIVRSSTGEGIEVRNFVLNPDYNLYWDLGQKYDGNIVPGENEITADPMFVKDTIPNSQLDFDYHLQKYSPAIDAGDPNILDVDGTRSDIGPYGGPGGEKYTYQDLAPRPPVNLTADMDSIAITLSWNRNTEADFSYYRIYRDTVTGFTIDSTKLISSQADTFYVQLIHDVDKTVCI